MLAPTRGQDVAKGRNIFSFNNTPVTVSGPQVIVEPTIYAGWSVDDGELLTEFAGNKIGGIEGSSSSIANSRNLGRLGEEAVGVGAKVRIPSLTGTAKYRIPDRLTSTTLELEEIKNVTHLSLTQQIKDFYLYSQQKGLQMILYTRPTTTFSAPLQKLIDNGSILVKPIPIR